MVVLESAGRLSRRGNCGTLVLFAFIPVNPSFIAAVQHLNGQPTAEIAPSPIDKNLNSCSNPRHEQCVHAKPRSEGDETVELMPFLSDRRDSRVTSDHRHDSLIVIMERSSRLSGDFSQDV